MCRRIVNLAIVLAVFFAATNAVKSAHAQGAYGRITPSGTWFDDNWADYDGMPFQVPTEYDYVYIGDSRYIATAAEPASVTLDTTAGIAEVLLGNDTTQGSYGNLTIQAGGILNAGYINVYNGLLDVQSNGTLNNAGDIWITGPWASANFDGTVVSNSISLGSGASASVNASISVAGAVSVDNSTLNLNATLSANDISLSGPNAVINRASGGHFAVQNLYLYGADYTYNGVDSVSNYVGANDGATFTADSSLNVNNLAVYGGASAAINAASSIGGIYTASGTVDINADTTVGSIQIDSGVLNLESGTLSGNLVLNDTGGGPSIVNKTAGHFNAPRLEINGATSLAIGADDNVTENMNLNGGATVDVGRDLSLTQEVGIGNATLNLDATLSANGISLSGPSAVINRTSGGHFAVQNLYLYNTAAYTYNGVDSILNYVYANAGSTFTADSSLNINNLSVQGSASAAINAASSIGNIYSASGTVDINADTTTGNTQIDNGVLNLESGTLSGNLVLNDTGSGPSIVNKTAGHFNAPRLEINGATSLAIGADDNVTENMNLNGGATVDVGRDLSLTQEVGIGNATLNLDATLSANGISLSGPSAVINRTSGGHFAVQNLYLYGADYTYNGVDSVSNYVLATDGATFDADSSLNINSLGVYGGAIAAINAASSIGNIYSASSTVDINADTTVGNTQIDSGVLNLESGTLSGNLVLNDTGGGPSIVNKTAGHFNAPRLEINGATSLAIDADDNVTENMNLNGGASVDVCRDRLALTSLALYGDSVLQFEQLAGATEGISFTNLYVDETSTLSILLDATSSLSFDWGLRWDGDHQSDLHDLIDAGSLIYSGGDRTISVIYDVAKYGDYTYLGLAPVPEPSAAIMAGILLLCIAGYKARSTRWSKALTRALGQRLSSLR